MSKLQKQCFIKTERLQRTHYFQSLLQEAYLLKLISVAELEDIQLQSLQLLAKQTEHYTGGESSSMQIETAECLMLSLFYSISVCLKSYGDPDRCVEVMKQKTLVELYQQGEQLIEKLVGDARQLYGEVQEQRVVTNNEAYNDTLENGIASFFSAYDVQFAAHETPAEIDYPLSNDDMDLAGIEYIYSYLQKMLWENQFCRHFSEHDISCLLRGYQKNYQELLINIFSLVLTNSLGSVLVGKGAGQLDISAADREYLHKIMRPLSKDELAVIWQDAAAQLCDELKISDKLMQEYIAATVKDIATRVKNAIDGELMETVFIPLKEKQEAALQFEDCEKMEDELFRSITTKIRDCRYVSDKLAIIKKDIHSFGDLVDILGSSCLFDDEYDVLFQSLTVMELALLYKKLPRYTIDGLHFTENEKEWQSKFSSFLDGMDGARREQILELAETISFV